MSGQMRRLRIKFAIKPAQGKAIAISYISHEGRIKERIEVVQLKWVLVERPSLNTKQHIVGATPLVDSGAPNL